MSTSTIILAILALAAIVFRSRITLWYAVARERRAVGKLQVDSLYIRPGETHNLNNYVDSLYGWAGSVGIRRNSDGSYSAFCETGRDRSGPPDHDTIYVNGRKVGRNMTVPIPAGATVIRRVACEVPSIRILKLV
ncbi:MAG: hypothetical protein JST01_02720 [Cyanobacteria bacterium SZAS TMP-1]|nr:hypothetical protein [Cyanobacteria bacterium SZAS TMP-1]